MSEEIQNENGKNEDRLADIFEKHFTEVKMATRRFEMIIYPAIMGMFVMAGVGFFLLFVIFSDLAKQVNASSVNCTQQKASFSQKIDAKDQEASLYHLKDQ